MLDLFVKNLPNIVVGIVVAIVFLFVFAYYPALNVWSKKENLENISNVSPVVSGQVLPFEDPGSQDLANAMLNGNIQQELSPEDLLPKTDPQAIAFGDQFPETSVDPELAGANFLTPGFSIGINTMAGSRKNQSRDIRSTPVIPRQDVGTMAQVSTIIPDLYRRPIDTSC
ncbi:MAG TPA: hypothetical protein V6C58_14250 [Allocoleopsis sp.]